PRRQFIILGKRYPIQTWGPRPTKASVELNARTAGETGIPRRIMRPTTVTRFPHVGIAVCTAHNRPTDDLLAGRASTSERSRRAPHLPGHARALASHPRRRAR